MKKVNAEKKVFCNAIDTVIVLCSNDNIVEEGLKHMVLYPEWKGNVFDSRMEYLTLADISAQFKEHSGLMVIAESPLDGHVYRYDNYGEKEWLEVGTTCGYV